MTKPSAVPQALYRDEALAARRSDTNVVLRFASPSFRLIAWFLTAMAIITLVFLFTFDYAKRIRVSGRVVYDEGIAHVYPLTDGVVAKKLVEEGSRVNAGDPLFRITADRQSTLEGSTASGVLLQLRQRSRLFSDQLNRLADLQRKDRISLLRKVEFLRSEVAQISKQLQSQSASVEINDRYLERFQKLVPEKYVPLVVFQEKALANQDAHTRMYVLQRDLTESERQLNDAVTELESFDSRA